MTDKIAIITGAATSAFFAGYIGLDLDAGEDIGAIVRRDRERLFQTLQIESVTVRKVVDVPSFRYDEQLNRKARRKARSMTRAR